MVAAVGAGVHGSYDDAGAAMVPEAAVVEPDPERTALYSKTYRAVYVPGLKFLRKVSGGLLPSVR